MRKRLNRSLILGRRESVDDDSHFCRHVVHSTFLVLVTNGEGIIVDVNPLFCKTFGFEREEILGRNPRMFQSGVHDDAWYAEMWADIRAGKVRRHQICDRAKDGRRVWLDVTIVPRMGSLGKPASYYMLSYDISEHKRAQEELEKAREESLAVVRQKEEFLANVTHEVRTPLSAIVGNAALLREEVDPEEAAVHLRNLLASADVLKALVNDVLDFSALDAGSMALEMRPLRVKSLVERVVGTFGWMAREKALDLQWEVLGAEWDSVLGDELRLTQILSNLISNALKFTARGAVVVSMELTPLEGEEISARLAVRDSGTGMTPSQIQCLFVRFGQAESSVARSYGGSGLGLLICQRLVSRMGGEISVVSEPGVGSEFSFRIRMPKADPSQPASVDTRQTLGVLAPLPEECSELVVAVADDDAANLRLLEAVLRRLGLAPRSANDGQELIEILESTEVDVAIIDANMPRRSGADVARYVHTHARGKKPYLILTSAATNGSRTSAEEEDLFDAVLPKPLDLARLRETLNGIAKRESSDRIALLRRELRNDSIVADIIVAFLETLRQCREALGTGSSGFSLEWGRQAHRLAGSARNVGARELAVYCSELETAGGNESTWREVFSRDRLTLLADAADRKFRRLAERLRGGH